jgi:signal peptidase I
MPSRPATSTTRDDHDPQRPARGARRHDLPAAVPSGRLCDDSGGDDSAHRGTVDLESNDTPGSEDAPPNASSNAPSNAPAGGRRTGVGCLIEIVETVALTVFIFLVIQNVVAQPFQVQMHSMEPTFVGGDYVLVDRLTHLWSPYARGQVVVFQPPANVANDKEPFIKRVIGVGGDTVEIRDGQLVVNGVALDEPYLFRDDAGAVEPTDARGQSLWVVPDGELFVMGDHRQVSDDSRVFGPIPVSSVIGRGVVRYWPLSAFGIVATPSYQNVPAP